MEQADIKQQYDQVLAVYSHKRSQCQNMERQIPLIQQEIIELKDKLANLPAPSTDKPEINEQNQVIKLKETLISEYQDLTKKLNRIQLQKSQNKDKEIESLNSELQREKQRREAFTFSDNYAILKPQTQLNQQRQGCLQEKINQIYAVQAKNIEAEKDHQSLQKEITSLKEQKSQLPNINNKYSEIDALSKQLENLNHEQKQLCQDLKQEEKSLKEHNDQTQLQKKAQNNQLIKIEENNQKLLSQLNSLEQQITKLSQHSVKKGKDSEVKELEDHNKILRKQVERMQKQLQEKKETEKKRREEEKRLRNKNKKKYQQEMVDEQNFNDLQTKELERDRVKLQNTIRVRKTYVSQQSLQILQKELERHQLKSKPNFHGQENKKQKLSKEKQNIKSRIDFLNNTTRELERQSQSKLRELKQKGDELVKVKLTNEKLFNQATYKLNQYMKQFPDHEKKKQEARNQQKKRKKLAKDQITNEQKLKQNKKRKKEDAQEKEEILNEKSDKTAWEEWNDWQREGNLPKKDERSFFNNRQFQMIAGTLAFLSMVALSFSS